MIENNLTKGELKSILKSILKLEDTQDVISTFRDVFSNDISSFNDIVEYTRKYNVTYKDYNIFISDIFNLSENSVYISMNFRLEKSLYHFFTNPSKRIVEDLKETCMQEIEFLNFKKFEKTVMTDYRFKPNHSEKLTYYFDASAHNYGTKSGRELSSLLIATSANEKYNFVEFLFNSNCYYKQTDKILLKYRSKY